MNLVRAGFVLGLLSACATARIASVDPGTPGIVMTHHIAEGKGEGSDLPPSADGGAPAPAPERAARSALASAAPASSASSGPPPLAGSQPDPEPLVMKEQWEYQVLFADGAARVEGIVQRTLQKPVATPRRMGRFALELWIGHELIDRVRFDFPMIAAEERPGVKRRPLHDKPSLASHAIGRVRVSLPASPRATRLMLVDRALPPDQAQELPWPPDRDGPVTAPAAVPGSAAQSPPPQ